MGRRVQVLLGLWLNARGLQVECTRVLHKSLLVLALVLMYDSETMLWNEKERPTAVQMDNLRDIRSGAIKGVLCAKLRM